MKKISTLFIKDPNDLGRVVNEINPQNEWVLAYGIATRKFDGTACATINGDLYKRYDCKIDKKTGEYKRPIPEGAIACQEADPVSGHHPHWIKCDRDNPADKYHFEGFDNTPNLNLNSTYELCGEKVQGNPERIEGHRLVQHGDYPVMLDTPIEFEAIKSYLEVENIEGVVFHHAHDERMCKIRKSDFGIKRVH